MSWRIGDYIFDGEKRIGGAAETRLNSRQGELLGFLIANYNKSYKDPDLVRKVWHGSNASGSLSKYIGVLRDALGGKDKSLYERKEIIDNHPYKLLIEPVLIANCEVVSEQGIAFPVSQPSASDQSSESSSAHSSDFTLIPDGMIINSVGELLFEDSVTKPIQSICAASYRRSLEDIAFAVVYASRLYVSDGFRDSLTKPDLQGKMVAARLSEISETRKYPPNIGGGKLLLRNDSKIAIQRDIRRFAKLVTQRRNETYFRDYMLREGVKHLGLNDTLFQDDYDPAKYEYFVGKPYSQDRQLQDELGTATDILARYLPEHPPNTTDRYALNALREFASRNVLSLITIMWEGYEFAKAERSTKMPHVLRALVGSDRILDQGNTQNQEIVKDFAIEHALIAALKNRRPDNRDNLLAELLNIRDDFPFKQIRRVLNNYELLHIEPGKERELAARSAYKELKLLVGTPYMQQDKVQFMDMSVIRAVNGNRSRLYEEALYKIFPELDPSRS